MSRSVRFLGGRSDRYRDEENFARKYSSKNLFRVCDTDSYYANKDSFSCLTSKDIPQPSGMIYRSEKDDMG